MEIITHKHVIKSTGRVYLSCLFAIPFFLFDKLSNIIYLFLFQGDIAFLLFVFYNDALNL